MYAQFGPYIKFLTVLLHLSSLTKNDVTKTRLRVPSIDLNPSL